MVSSAVPKQLRLHRAQAVCIEKNLPCELKCKAVLMEYDDWIQDQDMGRFLNLF